MGSVDWPIEAIAAIIFGLFQLGIGVASLWQQRQLRRAYREYRRDSRAKSRMLTGTRRKERRKKIYNLRVAMPSLAWFVHEMEGTKV
ncbi:hypothetical protein CC86DRAFT_368200 [Ophiobolus disseminans]|uniref:Uncharacterized protein n=1 Tax=Ophiobolus disseminans TaxID=1469910 RepID=A0A6A7A8J0_9PLEO|nr:hypothetical protein CC86DRAFT_368200 [Ophiobolus disseminans]